MRKNIPGTSPYEPIIGFSAPSAWEPVHLSGTGPVGADDDAAGRPAASSQSLRGLARPEPFKDVVRTRMFFAHAEDWEAIGRVHGEFFGAIRPPPPWSSPRCSTRLAP